MKKSTLILLAVVVTFAPLVGLIVDLQKDDLLGEKAVAFVTELEKPRQSEAYIYLMGIFAGSNEDPTGVGKKRIAEYKESQKNKNHKFVDYLDTQKLIPPEGKLFCRSWEDKCFNILLSDDVNLVKLRGENEILISRVNRLNEFGEYHTLLRPAFDEPFPPFAYVSKAERIDVLTAIAEYKHGEKDKAVKHLLFNFKRLRQKMELQDNLIGKLSYLMKASEVLDIVSVLLTTNESTVITDFIPELTLAEKDFSSVALREFGMFYYGFISLDKNPEFFELGGHMPGWIIRMLYKPNMTINAAIPAYMRLGMLSKLSPAEFAEAIADGHSNAAPIPSLRNIIGSALIIKNSPNFDEYAGRIIDFESKIYLFNQIHHYKRTAENIKNPFYPEDHAYHLEGSIYLRGPLKDERGLRSLKVSL